MQPPPRPIDEAGRLNALRRYDLLDTPPERALDELTALAAHICNAPISLVSLIDERRQWFKSNVGMSAGETSRDISFCGHAILQRDLFVVPDAVNDSRFADNPLVTGDPNIRFYAGAPLVTPEGHALGTLCVIDRVPRQLTPSQLEALRVVSRQVMAQLDLRRQGRALVDSEARTQLLIDSSGIGLWDWNVAAGTLFLSQEWKRQLGYADAELSSRFGEWEDRLHPDDREATLALLEDYVDGRLANYEAEFRLRHKDGSWRWVLARARLSRDAAGTPVRMRGCHIDITERKKSEGARRDSEGRYRALFESAPDGLVLADARSYYVDANHSMCRMLGYTRDELIGLHASDIVSPSEASHIEAALDTINSGSAYNREWQFRRKDGSEFSAEVMATVMPDGYLLGVVRDITDRKQAELKIRNLNRVYAVLSDINQSIVREPTVQDMLVAACRTAVAQGRFVMAWIGLTDPSDGPLVIAAHDGASDETLQIVRDLVAAGSRESRCVFTSRALDTGVHGVCNDIANDPDAAGWRDAASARGYRAMASLPLKAGERVVGSFNLYAGEPHFFDADELHLLDKLAIDIAFSIEVHAREAAARRVDEALRENEERFRQLAENIQEVFWMTDPATKKILYVSPAYERVWGRTCASLYAAPRNWLDAIHPDDRERVALAAETKQTGGGYDETYRILRPDGTIRWVHDRAFPVRGAAGDVVRVVGTAEDITEWRRLEEQFRQSQKMEAIGQLAGGVAHDFNNILTVMQGYGSLLMAGDISQGEAADAARQIVQASERAANLTRQLLAFSRRQVMQPQHVDLNEVVTSLAKMLQRILGEDVRLQLNLHSRPLVTRADAGMLDQVLMNLVVNARDAMPRGGQVVIETGERTFTEDEVRAIPHATPGRHVCLAVSDTGCGIPQENMTHLFEPFFTTKEPGKGTGLGLATVFGIVAQHHGFLQLETAVGRGTTFHINLPAVGRGEAQRDEAPATPKPRGGTERILIVEDEPSVRQLTRIILERNGYQVLEAADGIEALQVWDQHHAEIQLVLSDIVMPGGMTGRDLAARLRESNPNLRVIFTSGYSADIAGREMSLQEGQNFLQKPASVSQLLETVRRCLDA